MPIRLCRLAGAALAAVLAVGSSVAIAQDSVSP